jgi:hypothetical protein
MNITTNIDKLIESDPALAAAVQQAAKILETVAGNTVLRVTADWKFVEDSAPGSAVTLTLSEQDGAVLSARFFREEMHRPGYLRKRLHRLWGDLLQLASHKQMEKVKQLVEQLEEA